MTVGSTDRDGPRGYRRPALWLGLAIATAAAATIAAVPGFADAAEGPIRDAGTTASVPDSYVVVLKPAATAVEGSVNTLATKYGGTVGHVYTSAVRGFSAKMSEKAAKRLAANPAVSYVQRDGVVHVSGTQVNPPSQGLDRIDQPALPLDHSFTYPNTASAVHAYIIDTGIRTTHHTFGGRATGGFSTVDGGAADDCDGHGTHVAGTVGGAEYGVAKGVQLVAVRVLGCDGSGTTANVVAGIDWVTKNAVKPAVANLSLGGEISEALDAAVKNSIASGVTYAVAAGNESTDACSSSPARVPEAITVGAIGPDDSMASFSNFGTCVDLFAPGVDIRSSSNGSDTATMVMKGTSMATPHVTGAAALVLGTDGNLTPQQVRDELVNKATTGKLTGLGNRSPNKLLFVGPGLGSPAPGGSPSSPSASPTSTGPPSPTTGCSGTNGQELAVPDVGPAVTSSVRISGCDHATATASTVKVHIVHPYRGDLVIDLVAPDGSAYRLKESDRGDGAHDVDTTFKVNISGETTNGTWRLKVQDVLSVDSGSVKSWTLTV